MFNRNVINILLWPQKRVTFVYKKRWNSSFVTGIGDQKKEEDDAQKKTRGDNIYPLKYIPKSNREIDYIQWLEAMDIIPESDESLDEILKGYRSISDIIPNDDIFKKYNDMLGHGNDPSSIVYNICIENYCCQGLSKKAIDIYNLMKMEGVVKDCITYNSIIASYVCQNNYDDAMIWYNKMKASNVTPDISTCITVANLFLLGDDPKLAIDTSLELLNNNPHLIPNLEFCNTLIFAYTEIGDIQNAEKWLYKCKKRDCNSFDPIITFYMRRGDTRKVEDYMQRMIDAKIAFDTIILDKVMKTFLHKKHAIAFNKVCVKANNQNWTHTMNYSLNNYGAQKITFYYNKVVENGLHPTKKTWLYLMRALIHLKESRKAITVFKFFQEQGMVCERIHYLTVFMACCELRDPALLIAYFNRMEDDGIKPNKLCFQMAIQLLLKLSQPDDAEKWFNEMIEDDFNLKLDDFACFIHYYCKDENIKSAVYWFDKMILNNIEPDFKIYNAILCCCISQGNLEQAKFVVTRIKENIVQPDLLMHLSSKCVYFDNNDNNNNDAIYLPLLKKLQEEGLKADTKFYYVAMKSIYNSKSIDKMEIFNLYNYMKKNGIFVTIYIYSLLIKTHLDLGQVEFAFQCLKDIRNSSSLKLNGHIITPFIHYFCQKKDPEGLSNFMKSIRETAQLVPSEEDWKLISSKLGADEACALATSLNISRMHENDFSEIEKLIEEK